MLDEPLSPAEGGGVTVKKLSAFGCDPIAPALAWNGICFVQRGGQTVRWMSMDNQQGFTKDDYSVFASHLGVRQFAPAGLAARALTASSGAGWPTAAWAA